MKKKVISIILLAAFFASMAVSCGSAESVSGTSADTDASDEIASDITEPEKKYDFDGDAFNVIGGNGAMINFPYDEENGDVINDVLVARDRYIDETYNIKIRYNITESEEACKALTNSVLAGDNEYDMLAATAIDAGKIARNNILYNILEMDGLTTDAPYWSRLVSENCRLNGKLYFLSGDILPVIYTMPSCIFMNCDVAEKYGIGRDEVFRAVEDGEWTLDKLIDYTKDTSADLNGDGAIKLADDFIGYASLEGSLAAGVLAVGSGVKLCTENEDEKITVDLMNDRVLGLIEKARVLFADYKPNTNSDSLHQALRENRFIFSQHYTSSAFTRYRDVEADYSILPIPKYDEAQDRYYSHRTHVCLTMSIPVTNAQPDRTGAILDTFAYLSNRDILPIYYNVKVAQKGLRNDDSIEMLGIISESRGFDIGEGYGWTEDLSAKVNTMLVSTKKNNVASLVDSNRSKIEESINKTLELMK